MTQKKKAIHKIFRGGDDNRTVIMPGEVFDFDPKEGLPETAYRDLTDDEQKFQELLAADAGADKPKAPSKPRGGKTPPAAAGDDTAAGAAGDDTAAGAAGDDTAAAGTGTDDFQ